MPPIRLTLLAFDVFSVRGVWSYVITAAKRQAGQRNRKLIRFFTACPLI